MATVSRPAFSVASALIEKAAELYAIEPWDLPRLGAQRVNFIPRWAVIWTLRQLMPAGRQNNPYSYVRLAKLFGYADHTTPIYANRQAEKLRAADPKFKALTDQLLGFALTQGPQVMAA